MRRLVLLVALAALLATATACDSVRASAFRVGRTDVSQSTFDDELAVLHDNPIVAASVARLRQLPVFSDGWVTPDVSTRWLTLRISTVIAREELARRHGRVTAADRAAVGLPTTGPFANLPRSLRDQLLDMLGSVNAAARTLASSQTVKSRVPKACPSLRYVSHLLASSFAQAAAIKRFVDQGQDFAKLARANSIDTGSSAQGGYLGCLDDLKGLDATFLAAAAAQPIGVVSDPVQTPSGYSLILVTNQPGASDLRALALTVLGDELRHADVSVDPRYGHWDRTRLQVVPPKAPSG